MDDGEDGRLKALGDRIEAARRATEPPPQVTGAKFTGVELAWRMVIDLVAGVGVGCGIGYGLDSVLGTLPGFLILFTLLGFAAGVRVMMRSAAEYQAKLTAPPGGADATAPKGAE